MKHKLGFTLIELVIVIVILGILAMIAAPKFMNIQSDARKADLQQLAATLKSTIATVNAKAMIEGKETALSDTVDGISIANGYPTATKNGIVKSLTLSNSWYYRTVDMNDMLSESSYAGWLLSKGIKIETGMMIFSLKNLSNLSNTATLDNHCYVMYVDVAAGNAASGKAQSNANDGKSTSGWRNKLYQLHKKIWQKGICPYVLKPFKLDSYFTICSQPAEGKGSAGDKLPSLNAPMIKVVDDKC
ncbi:prepilin-type N-terminal cleavage/methylation domain-containing protein [Photobacterium toruni]|uniref:Prepilin-type N-terminal cleavage/methylation domain-containing protein n=1 Tax=Photobacterium toruni TaxID=1935446 RepID=A0ABU6L7G0_9GAMM|nr:prepilin-type N-terminal cleavage/methylation domain-containing protein [Photobacterium toruni]